MKFAYKSDIGRVRTRNEDYVGLFKNKAGIEFAVLADGLGGHRGGDVASEMAVSHLGYRFEKTNFNKSDEGSEWLTTEVSKENQQILERAQQYEDLTGMGTTLVCALFFGNQCLLANIGDSRGYLYREGKLIQVTEDHSFVNELVKRGQISSEEAKHHPQKNIITRTLGVSKNADLDEKILELEKDDLLLLCSDGLSNMVEDEQITRILQQKTDLQVKCQQLIEFANKAGGNDNITLLIAQLTSKAEVEIR
ncbi:Stp1/IreP family PP2C-type Ser/Thr phosphatase [Liquorilactobacillus capillatus]|uniref:protein-serine/threonine phosphatase n=1 Tax=Liquorilactobacillus capillatus DSM 19910 TaxID=1423731 RepID=A0A0R1M7H8_9LACO|nr:Stp1/IreP family PP2C-type Ser/Thr phosphatase [Liquorilactobacillus capillatus]KRL00714.1 serine threonine specific protein phosphatase [Liquorilactobacillus capillatus DSM 19910]